MARQKDWVVIKALEKPYINVLWLGTGILMIGFCVALWRRVKDYKPTPVDAKPRLYFSKNTLWILNTSQIQSIRRHIHPGLLTVLTFNDD